MIVLVFRSINEALSELRRIRTELDALMSRYERMMRILEVNAKMEEKIRRMGYDTSHRILVASINVTSTVRIHMVPQSSWLLGKVRKLLDSSKKIRDELERIELAMGKVDGLNATVVLILDEEARSKVVLLP